MGYFNKVEYNYDLTAAEVVGVCNKLIVDAKLQNSEIVSAFCGAMEVVALCTKGTKVLLKRTSLPHRIVKYNVAFIETANGMVFANPKYNRQLFSEAFDNKVLSDFSDYSFCTPLDAFANAKGLDFELKKTNGESCFVFVTAIYNKIEDSAIFPYDVNFFEIKIFEELKKKHDEGARVCVVIIVPRQDCLSSRFLWNLNPVAAAAIFDAAQKGIEFFCYGCRIEKNRIEIDKKIEIKY